MNKKLFGIKLGTVNEQGHTNGIADTNFVLQAINQYTHSFEIINYSLTTVQATDPTDPYRYGNEKLRKAIGGSAVTGDTTSWAALII